MSLPSFALKQCVHTGDGYKLFLVEGRATISSVNVIINRNCEKGLVGTRTSGRPFDECVGGLWARDDLFFFFSPLYSWIDVNLP